MFIFSNVFIPLIVLSAYFIPLANFLPDGVTKVFAEKSWKYTVVVAGATGLTCMALFVRCQGKDKHTRESDPIRMSDLVLLLLPIMPIVQYVIHNRDILPALQVIYILVIFLFFSLLVAILIPKALGGIASAKTMMLFGVAFALTILNMPALSNQYTWFQAGSLRIQWSILGGLFIVSWFLYDLNYRRYMYIGSAALFIFNTLLQIFVLAQNREIRTPEIESMLLQLISEREPLSKPDIYLLVYDAYVTNETMIAYGIDNRGQEEYLARLGFTLYPGTYSVANTSIDTMGRVLNASTDYGSAREAVSGNGVVQNALKSFGYETFGIFLSDYFFRGAPPTYDHFSPQPQSTALLITQAIFMGEFRFDQLLDEKDLQDFVRNKRTSFQANNTNPVFVYAHSGFPGHSQNSGQCLSNEIDLFKERLRLANLEMKQDLELLIKVDPEAIIIVAGDHGPYLTKSCESTSWGGYALSEITRLDIQDRNGAFLAIRWPGNVSEGLDDIAVLQDLFPSIFAYLFNDLGFLDAKVNPETIQRERLSGAFVNDGIIQGGVDDGEPPFLYEH
jgi:hypothetical protein